jgi:hypothetical protein
VHHCGRDVLGEAAHLQRACEFLRGFIAEVGASVSPHDELTPMQEAELENGYARWCAAAKEHLELATQYVREVARPCESSDRHGRPGVVTYGTSASAVGRLQPACLVCASLYGSPHGEDAL